MRKIACLKPPNFENRDDPGLLCNGGLPDVMFLVEGYKLFVHSKIVSMLSPKIHKILANPDPMFGKQIQFFPYQGRRRTKAGLIALLNAVYSPQLIPPEHLFDEVCDIAKEYEMDILLGRLKIGVVANCDVEPLFAAERQRNAGIEPQDVIYTAFAEFSADEFKSLEGYELLEPRTKVEVARRRVQLLENLLARKEMADVRARAENLFRVCPPELLRCDEDANFVDAPDLASSFGARSFGSRSSLNTTARSAGGGGVGRGRGWSSAANHSSANRRPASGGKGRSAG